MIFDPSNLLVITVSITFAGVLVAVLLIWIATRGASDAPKVMNEFQIRARSLEQTVSQLSATQSELSGRLKALADTQSAGQISLSRMMEERLDEVTYRMSSSLTDTASKTAETLGTLNTRLSLIDDAQKQISDLSREVVSLQDVLSNKQARGAFGEIQLADLVQDVLPPSAYSFQHTLSNGRRADCLIRLPSPPGPMVVDSKFPLEGFTSLAQAETEEAYLAAEKQFRSTMLRHIVDIAEKYIVPGETADSALLFLPSEGVYAALHSDFIDIVEKAFRARVWIVSPTTMMATLNTIRAVMKDASMREHADVIQKEVAVMMDDVERLKTRVGKLQGHFSQAERDIRDILHSTDKISRAGERIEGLKTEDLATAGEAKRAPEKQAETSAPARAGGMNGAGEPVIA
ncbi:MAG: DNA recombination protein RmuC [Pseudomonadota bacterium]